MKAAAVAPASYLSQLQQQITECDRKGGGNASIGAGEHATCAMTWYPWT